MKQLITSILAICLLFSTSIMGQQRGELVSDSLIATLDYAEIVAIYDSFGLPPGLPKIYYDEVELHKIVYFTLNGRGDGTTLASGLVALPIGEDCDFPLIAYNHGTHTYDEVISELTAKYNQHYVGVPMAANGYVAVLPDYLGYGATPLGHLHPYVHAKSEATCVVDALRATRELCENLDIELNEQLFLLGYSEGGHVTMATHKELQFNHSDEFTVTASAPCSGPYDLSGILRDSMLAGGRFSNSFFIAFVTLSYQYIYQNLYNDISEVFIAPYDSLILQMLSQENPQPDLSESLPVIGTEMFQPEYLAAVIADDQHPFNQNLRDNDLYDWVPTAPTALFYCTDDEQVPFENALFTAAHMNLLGGNVLAFTAGNLDHIECTFPAVLFSILWFDDFRIKCTSNVATELADNGSVHIYPNPATDRFAVSGKGTTPINLTIFDIMGRPISTHVINGSGEIAMPDDAYPAGNYIVMANSDGRVAYFKLVKI
jgi:pimeloyl-ACP methyl ester carboxylesterase